MEAGPANPPPGLCGTCRHARVIPSDRGQRFIRCGLSDTDQRYARYPPLPVAHCQGYLVRQPQGHQDHGDAQGLD
jgi:hypothetical protein